MAAEAETRIAELKARVEFDMTGRVFLALAEEYRRQGRLEQALDTLKAGLAGNPGYLAARVALGRVQTEMGATLDAVATFNRVLAQDREHLVAARSLGELYLARGDRVEAIKKFKLYRALSGDKTVNGRIAELERELAPSPAAPPAARRASVPPFEAPVEPPVEAPARPLATPLPVESAPQPAPAPVPEEAPFVLEQELVASRVRPAEALSEAGPFDIFEVPPRAAVEAASPQGEKIVEESPPVVSAPAESREAGAAAEERAPAPPASRTLADLYREQGHMADALPIYERLSEKSPEDREVEELARSTRRALTESDQEQSAPDTLEGRRAARVRTLRKWLAVVQANARAS